MNARLSQNSPLGKKLTPAISRRRKRSLSTGRHWRNRIVRGGLASGQSVKSYVYLNGAPVARIDNNSQIYYYHDDHLGSPQAMTDASGATVWKATYEPFGKATVTVSTIVNNLRLDGYWDQETNLSYNRARERDLNSNRFLSSDPIGLAGGLNTYLYAYANPLRYTDPDGLAVRFICRHLDFPGTNKKHCFVFVTCPEEGWSNYLVVVSNNFLRSRSNWRRQIVIERRIARSGQPEFSEQYR